MLFTNKTSKHPLNQIADMINISTIIVAALVEHWCASHNQIYSNAQCSTEKLKDWTETHHKRGAGSSKKTEIQLRY